MTTYNPDVQAGQIQGAAAQQAIDNAAAAARNAREGSGSNTEIYVLLGIVATLGMVLAVKRRTTSTDLLTPEQQQRIRDEEEARFAEEQYGACVQAELRNGNTPHVPSADGGRGYARRVAGVACLCLAVSIAVVFLLQPWLRTRNSATSNATPTESAIPSQTRSSALGRAEKLTTAEIAAHCSASVAIIESSDESGRPVAQGSGYIYSPEGVVITNYHVIRGAGAVRVKVPAHGWLDATSLLGYDTGSDIAALQLPASGLAALETENTDFGNVGDHVVAIGAPLGLEDTVSEGIISAVRRNGDVGLLQITASISHGSSGGPVLNEFGRVVGIATSTIAAGESLNFAVPATAIQSLLAGRSEISFALMRASTRMEVPLIGSTLQVPPRRQMRFSFTVPSQGADLQGDYRVAGGLGNDVSVMLLNIDGAVIANLGRVSAYGEVHQLLAQGRYVLAFDNGFSLLATKTVTPDVKLVYYR
jgi:S1-C subfamily serine protease